MKYHIVTALILFVALGLYLAGYSDAGNVCFILGGVFELWFWIRLFGKANT